MYNEQSIISKWVADIYDQKETHTHDVAFMLPVIGPTPKRILEVACGSGRILVPLAKAGHTVTGIDADEFMLTKIPAKAKGLSNINWRKADAVYDEWGTGYDVVVLAGNILYNIVSDMGYAKAQELLIQKAASALAPGGHVFIEYQPGGHSLLNPDPPSVSYEGDSDRVIWEGSDNSGNYGRMLILSGGAYDADTRLESFTRRFELSLKNGEVIIQDIPSQKHYASLTQLHNWLSDAGFIIRLQCGGYNYGPIEGGVIIYAEKGVA